MESTGKKSELSRAEPTRLIRVRRGKSPLRMNQSIHQSCRYIPIIQFTNPQGLGIPDAGNARFSGNAFTLMTHNSESGIKITPKTGSCRWLGEAMNDDLAVLGLLQLE